MNKGMNPQFVQETTREARKAVSSTTKADPQAEASVLVHIFGLACVLGGLLWWLLNISEPIGLPLGPPMVAGLIGWCC